jgi:hypothetical protein
MLHGTAVKIVVLCILMSTFLHSKMQENVPVRITAAAAAAAADTARI